jgi:hypothetical protein
MLLRGGGLSEAEIEQFRDRINSIIRKRLTREKTGVDEFREMLEIKWLKDHS